MKIVAIDASAVHTPNYEIAKRDSKADSVKMTVDAVANYREGFDVCVVAFDPIVETDRGWQRAPYYRTQIDSGYKANRPAREQPYFHEIGVLRDRLRRDGCHVYVAPEMPWDEKCKACDGFRAVNGITCAACHGVGGVPTDRPSGLYLEADDVLGWVAAQYREASSMGACEACDEAGIIGETCKACDSAIVATERWCLRIVSSDLDMAQLVDDELEIEVLSPAAAGTKDKEGRVRSGIYTCLDIEERFGILPPRVAQYKALAGDESDNYKPFPGNKTEGKKAGPGIGRETAKALLARYPDALSVVRAALQDPPPSDMTGNVVACLRRGGEAAARRGLELAQLRTVLPMLDFAPVLRGPLPVQPITERKKDSGGAGNHQPGKGPDATDRVAACDRASASPSAPPGASTVHPGGAAADGAPEIVAEMVEPSRALVRAPSAVLGRHAFQPHGFEDLERMALVAFNSRCYAQFTCYEQVMMTIIEAWERGIPVGAALRNAYIVRGKLAWSAAIMAACVLQSGLAKAFRIVETTAERAVLEYWHIRDAKAGRFEFTIQEARDAGWMKSGEKGDNKWITSPRTMLRWAAFREAARAFFPEVVSGMHTPDELREDHSVTDEELAAS